MFAVPYKYQGAHQSIPKAYYKRTLTDHTQRGGKIKKLDFGVLKKLSKLGDRVISGNVATKFKTAYNKRSNLPRAFKGEKHPISVTVNPKTGKMTTGFNSYMGPNTAVDKRLLAGIKPLRGPRNQLISPDYLGYKHDIEHALYDTPEKLGKSDKEFISGMKKIKADPRQHPNPSIDIGLRGIQAKQFLMKKGLMRKDKYLNPFPKHKRKARKIASIELKKIKKQLGTGNKPPAVLLRRKIEKDILRQTRYSRRGRKQKMKKHQKKMAEFRKKYYLKGGSKFSDIANMIVDNVLPVVVDQVAKKLPIVKRIKKPGLQMLKKLINNVLTQKGGKVKTFKSFKKLRSVIPFARKIAKLIMPAIIKMFVKPTKTKFTKSQLQKGKGMLDEIFKIPLKLLTKLITSVIDQKRQQISGKGLRGGKWNWRDFGKGFAKGFTDAMRIGGPIAMDMIGTLIKGVL